VGEPMAKSPILAALLNFIIWGLGYLYVGKRKLFGLLLVMAFFLTTFIGYYEVLTGVVNPSRIFISPFYYWVSQVGLYLTDSAFAYDAYQLAKEPLSLVDAQQPRS
jgi:hypothetical protein